MPESLLGWLLVYFLLALAAFAAGVVNSLAGGGTLITFPSLLGILPDAVEANATSTVALMPGSAASSFAFRRELRDVWAWLRVLFWPSVVGGAIGTLLVTRFPPSVFNTLVPWLILLAAVLFLVQPLIARGLAVQERPEGPPPWLIAGVALFQFAVGVYGGYFGAGIGILMLASLGLMGIGDIHRVNALKTFLAMCINAVSVVLFVAEGKVVWHLALVMAAAAIAGGFLGAVVGRGISKGALRWFIIVLGFSMSLYCFLR